MTATARPALRLARIAAMGCAIAAALAALWMLVLGAAVLIPDLGVNLAAELSIDDLVGPLTTAQRLVAALLGMVPVALSLWLFVTGARAFAAMAAGRLFEAATAAALRRLGWLMIALVPARAAVELLGTGILSAWASTTGEGRISVAFDAFDLYSLVTGLIVLCLGHVLAEAVTVADENRSFV